MRRSLLIISFVAAAGVSGACAPEVKPGVNSVPGSSSPNSTAPGSAPASPGTSPALNPSVTPTVDPKSLAAPSAKLSALEGKWPGVEGTYLNVTRNGDKYSVEIKNLDKTETFEGKAKDDTIIFKRNDKLETIKAATAEETGMKWLAGEKTCVVINKGSEGYCRK